MGVYTYLDHTLGLSVGGKLLKIRDTYKETGEVSEKDFIYLANQAARYETIQNRATRGTYKVSKDYDDLEFEINELFGDTLTELTNVYFMNINDKKEYVLNLSSIFMLGKARLSIHEMLSEISQGYDEVVRLQKDFDYNGDGVTVVGTFENLKKGYNLDISFTTAITKEELQTRIRKLVMEVLEKEMADLQSKLNEIKREK